jgi:hypothetical protein
MVTAARFKQLCMSLPGTSEVPHFERLAYRTPRKIYATLPPDGKTANLLLVPELQEAVVEALPHAFQPVPGGWGRMGYTTVDLAKVTENELVPVLQEAHALASESAKRKLGAKPAKKKRTASAAAPRTKWPAKRSRPT